MLAVRDILEQLGDVGQVGHVAFAALPGQHAPAHALQLGGLEDGGDTAVARMSAHSRSVSAISSVRASPPSARSVMAVLPKNMVDAAARTTPARCGWSNASSSASQSAAAWDSNTSESPVWTAWIRLRSRRP